MTGGARQSDAGGRACFGYHRSIAPMLWALVALSLAELCLMHLLVAVLWSPLAAAIWSIVTLAGTMWLVASVRSFRRLPVVVGPRRVLLRVGRLRKIVVPRTAIVAIGGEIGRQEMKARDVLRLSLLAHPNVVIRLAEPIACGRRAIATIVHRLDDPAAFRAAALA